MERLRSPEGGGAAGRRGMRTRRIFFDRGSECLRPLSALIDRQGRRALVMWALEYADELVERFGARYPHERRLREAVEASRSWACGEAKMPVAREAILAAHAAAAEVSGDIAYCSVAHAVGQCCSVVHARGHALGGPMYALTAIAHETGAEGA
ncbi:MAG: hypothetical protein FWH47_07510 [Methanomassiliicoccaceae archaeon]|nr:hypothetical protein [Methanomassiliicoccaceae archaeon]